MPSSAMLLLSGGFAARLIASAAVISPVVLPWDGHLGRNGEGVFVCVVLAGVGHPVGLQQPDELTRLIDGFASAL